MRTRLVALFFTVLAPLALADTYTVSSKADSGPGTLRQAILDANAHPGLDLITQTATDPIVLKSPLPVVTDPVKIGFATGVKSITLDGRALGAGANGLVLAADDCWLYGVFVGGFDGAGIVFKGKRGAIDVGFIGIDQAQNPLPNGTGIRIEEGADATIGAGAKVFIVNSRTHGLDVRGNVDIESLQTSSNGGDGVHIDGATSLKISEFTLSAANGGAGVSIAHSSNTGGAALNLSGLGGVASIPPNNGIPLSITDSHDLTLTATPRSSRATGVVILDSSNIDLTVTEADSAGEGVRIERSTNVTMKGSIANSAGDGIHAIDSGLALSTAVSGSHGHGLFISGGSAQLLSASPLFATFKSNTGDGVHAEHSRITVTTAASSANGGDGIALLDHSDGSNLTAGTTVTGNGGAGVRVDQTSACTLSMVTHDNLGGPVVINGAAATGNVITGAGIETQLPVPQFELGSRKGRAGVLISGGASNNRITKTTIVFQGGPAVGIESGSGNHVDTLNVTAAVAPPIDLGMDGLSVATTGGTGANGLQPAPVIERVLLTSTANDRKYTMSGLIPGSHGGSYDLDVYWTVSSEWHTVQTVPVVADAAGRFTAPFSTLFYITPNTFAATVTDAAGNTSEMSAPRGVALPTALAFYIDSRVLRGNIMVGRIERLGSDIDHPASADWMATGSVGGIFAHGSVSFAPGEVRKTLTVNTFDCEGCQYFNLDMANVAGAAAGSGIRVFFDPLDTRSGASIPTELKMPEGDALGAALIPIRRYTTNLTPLHVTYHTEADTAKEGEDFVGVSGSITMAADQAEALVAVPIRGDGTPEADESFKFIARDEYGNVSTCVITLTDDDGLAVVDASASGNVLSLKASNLPQTHEPARVAFDVVRITPFGEEVIDHQYIEFYGTVTSTIDTKQGPVEVRLKSTNIKLPTRVVAIAQSADAAFTTEKRTLDGGKNEQLRVARLTPADAALDVPWQFRPFYAGGSLQTGTLHFDAGQTIGAISVDVPALPAGLTNQASLDLLKGGNPIVTRVFNVSADSVPLVVVSSVVRDAANACVTFDSAAPLPNVAAFNVRGDWTSAGSGSSLDRLTIPAGGTHTAYCTTRTASDAFSWVNVENSANVRFSTDRVWIGIDPYSSIGGIPQTLLGFRGPTVEEPRSGIAYAEFAITSSYPTTPMQFVVETIDGTAIAGRDYTPVVTSVDLPGGDSRAIVRVPILAAGGTPPDGKYFFVAVRGGSSVRGAGVVTIVPAGKGISRRRS